MSKPRLLVTAADLAPKALELLTEFEVVYAGKAPTAADLLALCKQHDPTAIIVRYGAVGPEMMDAAPSLRVISKHGSGTDTIDKVAAQARGIEVRAAFGANSAAVAEQAMALLLACAKSVVELNARMHAGFWDKPTHKNIELSGRTIGIVGLGAIGQRFARMCDAFGMKVLGFDPFAQDLPAYIQRAPLETIWRESEAISLHCPLTPENRNMINAQVLASCKRGLLLVNTARGGLVDEAALLEAMKTGQVAAAGLDSFAVEPMPVPHPFQNVPRLILSPHIGAVTHDAYISMGVAAASNVLDSLQKMAAAA